MKGYVFLTALLLLACVFFQEELASAENTTKNLWQTDYKQALQKAKATSTPVLLFFTGSDWCGWCKKLEKEVFNTPEFNQSMSDKLIFVLIDYPMKTSLDAKTQEQNQQLKKKYAIKSYPTVILINSDEELIGTTGYRSGGAHKYAHHLMKMVQEFDGYKHKMKKLAYGEFSGKELKRLYQIAQELGQEKDANQLIQVGINSDLSYFFLFEQYRALVKDGAMHTTEAAAIKQQLLASDPQNEHLSHYQVAVAEFEMLSEGLDYGTINADAAVSPLVNYTAKFQENDKDNIWKLNIVISQVYLDENQLGKALQYAQAAHAAAPSSIQQEISLAVKKIQSQIAEAH